MILSLEPWVIGVIIGCGVLCLCAILAIILLVKKKNKKPRSLAKFNAEEYGKKGTSLLIGTFFGTLVLTEAIINFSLVNFLTYVFTTTMAIVFGVLEMKKYEEYYITEYWEYAQMIKEDSNNDTDK